MLDAMCIILSCSIPWYSNINEIPFTGMPLLFSVLACAWYTHLLPSSVYFHGFPNILHIFILTLLVDFMQFFMHLASHKKIFGSRVYSAHNEHHKAKDPMPKDAFTTGLIDAMLQLILPMYVSICMIEPNRTTIIIFGLLYSQWLLYIHSQYPELSQLLVSPKYHKEHHKNLKVNLAHVFPIWDHLSNTYSVST